MTSEVVARRLNEFDFFRGEKVGNDHFLHVSPERRAALLANPYLECTDEICEWVGFADGKPAGFNYSFPVRIWADGKSYHGTTGSSLNVQEWARKTDLGLVLPAKGVDLTSKDGIAIAAMCSQMAIPLHKINGYKYFFSPRYIALWKSRSVLERMFPKWLVLPVSFFVDAAIWLYAILLKKFVWLKLRNYYVEEVSSLDETVLHKIAAIVSMDGHRFREDHGESWFKWHLEHSFSEDGPCKVYALKENSSGEVVAFSMLKRRFHKQASSRGFKNVWLTSMLEWGTQNGHEEPMKWLILHLGLEAYKSSDAFELATDDSALQSFARRLGWRHVGEANVGVKIMKSFPLFGDKAIKEQSNWRIRPGMGDNALS